MHYLVFESVFSEGFEGNNCDYYARFSFLFSILCRELIGLMSAIEYEITVVFGARVICT